MRAGLRLLPPLVIAASLTLLWTPNASSAPTRSPQSSHEQQSQPITQARVATFAGAINTHNKAAVNTAYHRRFAKYIHTPVRWTGNTSHCKAGKPSHKSLVGTLSAVNFVRAMAGLAPVRFDKQLSSKAQKAALIMDANNALSHYPPRSWRCWSRTGANAAHHSNLEYGSSASPGIVIVTYMDDNDSSNIAVGHRRWILYPPTTTMGSGTTSSANALWVVGPTDPSRPNPKFVPWPPAGWFPTAIEPYGRWSLAVGDSSINLSHANVTVTTPRDGRLRVHKYPVEYGYGQPTLVWDVKGVGAKGTFKVKVKNIRQPGRAPFTYSYTVRLFVPTH